MAIEMNYLAFDSRKLPLAEDKELEGLLECQILWPAHFPFRPVARYYPTVDELPHLRPAALRSRLSMDFQHNFMLSDGGEGAGLGAGLGESAFEAVKHMRG
jgi:hypothetical protein